MRDPAKPTAFGEESTRFGERSLETTTEHGNVSASSQGPTLDMRFPDEMPRDAKRELARDALSRLNLEASDAAIDAALDAQAAHKAENPTSDAPARIDHVLHVHDEATTVEAARDILFSPERVAERDGKGLDQYKNKCSKDAGNLQHKLAAQGMYAPIMNNGSHRYLVVGNQIIDPTFAQFFPESSKENDGNEPFIGDYDNMLDRLSKEVGGEDAAKAMLEKEWGILGKDKDGNLQLAEHVVAFNGNEAVVPKNVDDVKRLMEEQEQNGLTPGAGLPPHLVRQARGEAPDVTTPTENAPKTKQTEDGFEIPIDPFATPAPAPATKTTEDGFEIPIDPFATPGPAPSTKGTDDLQVGGSGDRRDLTPEQRELQQKYNPSQSDANCGYTSIAYLRERLGIPNFQNADQMYAAMRERLELEGDEHLPQRLIVPNYKQNDPPPLPTDYKALEQAGADAYTIRAVADRFGVTLAEAGEVLRNAAKMRNPDAMDAHAEQFGDQAADRLRTSTPGEFVVWGGEHYMTMTIDADGNISGFDPQTGERYPNLAAIQKRLGTSKPQIWRATAKAPKETTP
ncbi:MAG: hypothetical protein ACKV2T_05030 [Kofleriaceae bacterium]